MQLSEQTELVVRVTRRGDVARITELFELHNPSSRVFYVQSDRTGELVRMVPGNPAALQRALEEAGFKCDATPVVLLQTEFQLGVAARCGALLRQAGIGILYSYTTFHQVPQVSVMSIVFKTADNARALKLFRDGLGIHPQNESPQASSAAFLSA